MKSKVLIASVVLLGASVAVAAPAQAHDEHWPLYALTGLALVGAYSSHHHNHGHGHYGGHRGHYAPRRHSSSHGYRSGRGHGSSHGRGPSHGSGNHGRHGR